MGAKAGSKNPSDCALFLSRASGVRMATSRMYSMSRGYVWFLGNRLSAIRTLLLSTELQAPIAFVLLSTRRAGFSSISLSVYSIPFLSFTFLTSS
eukprot:scaffold1411_cov396-Prasinococcus_capsulatus_cf.AAC.29